MSSFFSALEMVIGAELYRTHASYIARWVLQPRIVHDFQQAPGTRVRMKKFAYWNDNGSYNLDARSRNPQQVLGTGGARGLTEENIEISLKEMTGPSSGNIANPSEPGVLKISTFDIITAQRDLYQMAQATQFHDSIGSNNLINDYQATEDGIYLNLALSANPFTSTGGQMASDTRGGYLNPNGVANGGTYNTTTGIPKIDIVRDVTKVVADMHQRMVPPFQSNYGDCYHALCTPGFLRHLRQDPEFRKVVQYPGYPVQALQYNNSPTLPDMVPLIEWTQNPNQLVRDGYLAGQTGFGMTRVLPTGILFEGVRWFVTNNLSKIPVQLTTSGLSSYGYSDGTAVRNADYAIIFGRDVIGEAVWGNGPTVRIKDETDYQRFLFAIWHKYAGYVVMHPNHVTVLRTFDNF